MDAEIYDNLRAAKTTHNAFAVNLLRDLLIPDILQEDTSSILYWAGKNMARKYPLPLEDQLITFFLSSGFGELTKVTQKDSKQTWQLSGEFVKNRFIANKKLPDFNLEAGFLAQQIEQLNKIATEANFKVNKRDKTVLITIQTEDSNL